MHLEPVNFYGGDAGIYDIVLPHAEELAQHGFYLPTHSFLEREDVIYISSLIKVFFDSSLPVSEGPRLLKWVDAQRSKLLGVDAS